MSIEPAIPTEWLEMHAPFRNSSTSDMSTRSSFSLFPPSLPSIQMLPPPPPPPVRLSSLRRDFESLAPPVGPNDELLGKRRLDVLALPPLLPLPLPLPVIKAVIWLVNCDAT